MIFGLKLLYCEVFLHFKSVVDICGSLPGNNLVLNVYSYQLHLSRCFGFCYRRPVSANAWQDFTPVVLEM